MANGKGDVQLSWMTIVGAGTVVGLMAAAGWTIFQNEFANVKETAAEDRRQSALYYNTNRDDLIRRETEIKATFNLYLTKDEHRAFLDGVARDISTLKNRLDMVQRIQEERSSKLARDPVEQKTIDAINTATDKRIDLIQAQITDINRQIAAALIIIDNNATARKTPPTLPP
jgi:hypothetical protein